MKESQEIMLVDDDEEDRKLLNEALIGINADYTIKESINGEEALLYLQEKKASGICPVLIVLDLYMPKMNGLETLFKIKADIELARIPVVLYYDSCSQSDILLIGQFGVEWIMKPSNMKVLSQAALKIFHCIEDKNIRTTT
jgi:CheY-like chemotaxis protein